MKNLDQTAEELFAKIRGRFPGVTIGNDNGNVTQEPTQARFFEFPFREGQEEVGKISISLSEDDGIVVMYNQEVAENDVVKSKWYDFLKELRMFAKKRMLNFETRDITKSNLEKRDYQYLARTEESKMNESKLYGTSRVSYQNVDNARLVIKHTENVNQELASGRTQKIGKIYIESSDGERFMYPYKHLSGARAMARHVAEGGKPYDDFGKHIVGLSEELASLRKFKTYMGRSSVMAESLSEYMDVVKERIQTVKKTVESLQKPSYYKEASENFEVAVMEDVPSDVAENWIDQLTIKQFNEELADVFPYIYKLVSEATKAKELGPEDIVDESGLQRYTGIKKYGKKGFEELQKAGREGASEEEKGAIKDKYLKKKTKEEIELEAAFEATLGQFSEDVCEECGNPSWTTLGMTEEEIEEGERHGNSKIYDKCWKGYRKVPGKKAGEKGSCKKIESEQDIEEAYIKTRKDAIEALGRLRGIGKKIETGRDTFDGNLANMYVSDVYDVYSWMDSKLGISGMNDPKLKQVLDPVMQLRGEAKKLETKPGSGENARFGNQIVNTLYPLMVYIEDHMEEPKDEGNAYAHAVRKAKMDGKKKGDKVKGPDGDEITLEKEDKLPLSEFILSYFDRESGQFPKGETAILTMVEKDYGEEFIEPAKAFIEQVGNLVAEMHGYRETEEASELERIRGLAGI